MDAQLLALALRRLTGSNWEGPPENPYFDSPQERDAWLEEQLRARNGAPLEATENDPGYAAKMARGDFGVANSVPDRLVASVPIASAGDVTYNVQRGPSTFKQDNKDMVAILQARHAAGASPPPGVPVATQLAPPPPGTPVVTQLVERPSAGNAYGAIIPGNIDLTHRPYVQNADGSISTVRSMGVNIDGKEVLIPTVSPDGRIMSDDEAVAHYMKTGQHLGIYATPEASTAAGEAIHQDQMAHPPIRTNPPAAIAAPSSLPPISNTQQLYAARQALLGRQVQGLQERAAIEQAGKQQEAQLRASAGQYGMARFSNITQRVEDQRRARDYFRGQAEQHIMKLRSELGEAPKTTAADIMGLISGILMAGGNSHGQAVGALMGGLSQIMMRPYQRWQAGLEQHGKLAKEFEALAQGRAHGAEADLSEEKHLSDLLYANVANGIEQIRANTSSVQVKSLLDEGMEGLFSKYLDLKEKQFGDHSQLIDQYNMMDPNELAQLIQDGKVGKIGQDVYNEREQQRLARIQQNMDIASKQQKLSEGPKAPALGKPGTEILPGYVATTELTGATVNEVQKKPQLMASIKGDLDKLTQIRQKLKNNPLQSLTNADDIATGHRVILGMVGKLTNFYGRGAPQKFESDQTLATITDPSGWYLLKDPEKIYQRFKSELDQDMRDQLAAVGVVPREQESSASTPSAGTQVRMQRGSDKMMVPQHLVQQAQRAGYHVVETTP